MKREAMKFISMFSGIEAASVASKNLGWTPVAFSEIDTFANAVLAHHYPEVPNLGDMSKVNWSVYDDSSIGLVCGGSPCQAFSVAGLRESLNDPRGNLTLGFMRAIRAIKSKWIFWENVPGTFSAKENPFGKFLAGLCGFDTEIRPPDGKWAHSGFVVAKDDTSYSVTWRILDAQHFGVPQRRRRIFLVGHIGRGSWWKPLEVLLERHRENGHSAQSGETRKEVAGNAGSGVEAVRSYTPSQFGQYKEGCGTLRANSGDFGGGSETLVTAHGQGGAEIREGQAPCLTCNHETPILFEHHMQDSRIKGPLDCSPQLNAKAGTGGGNLPLVLEAQTQYGPVAGTLTARYNSSPCSDRGSNVVIFAQNQEGELRTSEIANTVTTSGNASARGTAKQFSCSIVRRLTPQECEALQGFPRNYTRIPYRNKPAEQCPDGPRYKALGNSWAVPCVRWIFERMDALENV